MPKAPKREIKDVWIDYKKNKTEALRNVLMEHYLHLTTRVPVLDVRFRPGMETLAHLLDGIEQATKAAWHAPS